MNLKHTSYITRSSVDKRTISIKNILHEHIASRLFTNSLFAQIKYIHSNITGWKNNDKLIKLKKNE